MCRSSSRGLSCVIAVVVLLAGTSISGPDSWSVFAQQTSTGVPTFEVDPSWPTIPAPWLLGEVSGVAVDEVDHVWIVQRPQTVDQKWAVGSEPEAECCTPAPPVLEFDQEGRFLRGWGGPNAAYEWPEREHGLHVDYRGNVWVSSAGGGTKVSNQLLKFTKSGKFLLQIGHAGKSGGSLDTENLNQAADMYVYSKTNELFVADGYVNRRVIVFDADTGAFKRLWGAYGNPPDDTAPRVRTNSGTGPAQFNLVHGIRVSSDGLVYVADRVNNRVQVFTTDGSFVKETFIARGTKALGTAFGVGFSPDERFMYVPDGSNAHVWMLDRNSLAILGSFGRYGNYAGQFQWLHSIAVDSKGNIYTGEVGRGRRVQKFVYRGMSE